MTTDTRIAGESARLKKNLGSGNPLPDISRKVAFRGVFYQHGNFYAASSLDGHVASMTAAVVESSGVAEVLLARTGDGRS
jgi:hypothetical protein